MSGIIRFVEEVMGDKSLSPAWPGTARLPDPP